MDIKKKDIKYVNDMGKNLAHNKYYNICDNYMYSLDDDENETQSLSITTFTKEEHIEILKYMDAPGIDGGELGRVIAGTGLVIDYKTETLNESISLSLKSKVLVQKVKTDMEYNTGIDNDIRKSMVNIHGYNRYFEHINKIKDSYSYELVKKEIEELLDKKKFIIDVSDKLGVKLLKISNKMMKNFNKTTKSVTFKISDNYIIETPTTNVRLLCIEISDGISTTKSYYSFLD